MRLDFIYCRCLISSIQAVSDSQRVSSRNLPPSQAFHPQFRIFVRHIRQLLWIFRWWRKSIPQEKPLLFQLLPTPAKFGWSEIWERERINRKFIEGTTTRKSTLHWEKSSHILLFSQWSVLFRVVVLQKNFGWFLQESKHVICWYMIQNCHLWIILFQRPMRFINCKNEHVHSTNFHRPQLFCDLMFSSEQDFASFEI